MRKRDGILWLGAAILTPILALALGDRLETPTAAQTLQVPLVHDDQRV